MQNANRDTALLCVAKLYFILQFFWEKTVDEKKRSEWMDNP